MDPEFPKHKRKFKFHRDPRDISQLYFYDELSKRYVTIPYRDSSLPAVSVWELRNAQGLAEKRGISKENEKAVFAIINEQRGPRGRRCCQDQGGASGVQRRTEHEKTRARKKTSPMSQLQLSLQRLHQRYGVTTLMKCKHWTTNDQFIPSLSASQRRCQGTGGRH